MSGDLATTLSDSFLSGLYEEALRIVEDVKAFTPDQADFQDMTPMLASSEAEGDRWSFQKTLGGNKEPKGTFVLDLLAASSGEEWLFRLRYPMLARDEIRVIREGPSALKSRPHLPNVTSRHQQFRSSRMPCLWP